MARREKRTTSAKNQTREFENKNKNLHNNNSSNNNSKINREKMKSSHAIHDAREFRQKSTKLRKMNVCVKLHEIEFLLNVRETERIRGKSLSSTRKKSEVNE